jgi:hypothetical protein
MRLYEDVEVSFVPESHKYLVSFKVGADWTQPKPTMGVTTYCGALSKDFLAPWAAKLAAEYALAQKGLESDAVVLDEAKKQFKQAADAGARAGKLGHLYVEAQLTKREVTMPSSPEDKKVVESVARAFEAFMEDWTPEIIEAEKVLYSKAHNYAGTCDLVCKIKDKLIVLDWKTTNVSRYNPDGIYATYFAQLGAYSLAYEEMTGEKVGELYIVNLPKDGGDYKLKRLEDLGQSKTDCQAYFLALKSAYEQNIKFEWSLRR